MSPIHATARRATRLTVLAMSLALTLSACGGDDSSDSKGSSDDLAVKVDQAAKDLLPADVASKGAIKVVMDGTQGKPFTYFAAGSSKQMEGLTADLTTAIGKALGVKVEIGNTSFDNLIPGLQAGRFDLAVAPMLMTDERLKSVDMIGWLHGGSSFLVAKSGGQDGMTLDKTCGMTIGAASGSVEAIALEEQSDACVADGRKPVTRKLYPHTTDGLVALTAGRLDAFDSAAAQTGYMAKANADLKQSGEPYSSGTSSMAMPKDSKLAPAFEAALQSLIDSGVYAKIVEKYGVQHLAVPSASLNKPV